MLFESGSPGRSGFYWPAESEKGQTAIPGEFLREDIPGLFNTGVDDFGMPLPDDVPDPHYTLIAGSAVTGTPVAATSSGGFPIGPWLGDGPYSAWIAPNASTDGPHAASGVANFQYQISFNLGGALVDPSSAIIAGQWSTDNEGIDILINGNPTGQPNTAQFTAFTPFRINRGFVAGLNTLTFLVNNGPGADTSSSPTGLRVEMTGTFARRCFCATLFFTDRFPTIQWLSDRGIHYVVEFTTNLGESPWNPAGPVITAEGPVTQMTDSTVRDRAPRFYRVRRLD